VVPGVLVTWVKVPEAPGHRLVQEQFATQFFTEPACVSCTIRAVGFLSFLWFFNCDMAAQHLGGSGTLTHVSVYSTQFYYQRSQYSGTFWYCTPVIDSTRTVHRVYSASSQMAVQCTVVQVPVVRFITWHVTIIAGFCIWGHVLICTQIGKWGRFGKLNESLFEGICKST
jgi:hypothetical protein